MAPAPVYPPLRIHIVYTPLTFRYARKNSRALTSREPSVLSRVMTTTQHNTRAAYIEHSRGDEKKQISKPRDVMKALMGELKLQRGTKSSTGCIPAPMATRIGFTSLIGDAVATFPPTQATLRI